MGVSSGLISASVLPYSSGLSMIWYSLSPGSSGTTTPRSLFITITCSAVMAGVVYSAGASPKCWFCDSVTSCAVNHTSSSAPARLIRA